LQDYAYTPKRGRDSAICNLQCAIPPQSPMLTTCVTSSSEVMPASSIFVA
jgi:hypothetical protein